MPESKSGALPLGYAPTRAPYSGGTAAVQRKPARWGATRPLHFAVTVDHLPLDARIGHFVGDVDVPDFGQVLRRVGLERRLEPAHVGGAAGPPVNEARVYPSKVARRNVDAGGHGTRIAP